jgi:DNA-directed RNA polymerase subunit RPC12/RpoP
MARVIKAPPPVREVATWKDTCGATVEFEPSDVKSDQRDGPYVVCPHCKSWISSSLLKWKKKRT